MNNILLNRAKYVGQSTMVRKKTTGTEPKHHIICMKTVFSDPKTMVGAIRTLRSASADDKVTIVINSPGGNVYAVTALLNAIKACEAKIHTHVSGAAFSCGFILFIAGDTMSCSKYGSIMAHGTSHMAGGGNTIAIKEQAGAIESRARALMEPAVTKGILTAEELSDVFDKKLDLYLDHKFLNDRGVLSNAKWNA